jgi:hypothetical protein
VVGTATYMQFAEGGGYVRREWWPDEGWAWKEQYDISRARGWCDHPRGEGSPQPVHPSRPMETS